MVEKLKPWLWVSPQLAHNLGPKFLKFYGKFKPYQTLTWSPRTWKGIEFNNPLGLAGGVDKDALNVHDWWTLGPGFIEIGTVTPKPQESNKGQVIDRDYSKRALWNRLGFPSKGVEFVSQQLNQLYQPRFTPIFANIGMNRETPLEQAHEDYIKCMQQLRDYVDCFVINISSPNTEGLRDLLKPSHLSKFLKPIIDFNATSPGRRSSDELTPLLLKLSPDIERQDMQQIISTSAELGVSGWVIANSSQQSRSELKFPQAGGVSGRPIANRSKALLSELVERLGEDRKKFLIVSCGGVLSPHEVFERLELGADLVQVYSALIFEGPFFFRNVAQAASLKYHASSAIT